MKTLKMIWIGCDLPEVTSGREYAIIGRKNEGGYFSYIFINNKGQEDSGASFQFARPRRRERENFKNAISR